jgi:hypothetical protein
MIQPDHDKIHSRGISRDMCPESIERRLDIVSDLRSFTEFLSTARKIENKPAIQSQSSELKEKSFDIS